MYMQGTFTAEVVDLSVSLQYRLQSLFSAFLLPSRTRGSVYVVLFDIYSSKNWASSAKLNV